MTRDQAEAEAKRRNGMDGPHQRGGDWHARLHPDGKTWFAIRHIGHKELATIVGLTDRQCKTLDCKSGGKAHIQPDFQPGWLRLDEPPAWIEPRTIDICIHGDHSPCLFKGRFE